MSDWGSFNGTTRNQRLRTAGLIAIGVAAIGLIVLLLVLLGRTADKGSDNVRINNFGQQTTTTVPYVAPTTVVSAPVPATTPRTVVPNQEYLPESAVDDGASLSEQFNQGNSGLSPDVYTDASNRAADIVTSLVSNKITDRYPGFFVSSPTMSADFKIVYSTAAKAPLDDKYIRGVVYWSGTQTNGGRISQGITAIYMRPGNLQPVNPEALPAEIQYKDPAIFNQLIE